jgi:hypothetical protein
MSLPADVMSNPVTPPPEPTYIILARKLILLSLIMVVAALGLVILFRHVQAYFLLLPHVLSDAAMGLIAGFSVRWILRKQTAFLRIASILAFVICGLELVGWFTGWQVGLGRLKIGRASVDWFGLGQLILSAGIAFLALYAWKHPIRKVEPAEPPPEVKETVRPRKWPKRHSRLVAAPETAEKVLDPQTPPAKGTGTEAPAKPKWKRVFHHKPQLHLSAEEEHRCPYCLELIVENDPRGTVECKICHTLHHADCWAITGACQVPHYTA